MTKNWRWDCPACGYFTDNFLDAFDHIVKEHTNDYADSFHPTKITNRRGAYEGR